MTLTTLRAPKEGNMSRHRLPHRLVVGLLLAAAWAAVPAPAGAADVFVATTSADYGTGSIALLRDGAAAAETNVLTIHSDAVARYFGGYVYVVNRAGQDNILLLDPAAPRSPRGQYSVGNGTNPQDILVLGPDKAYVTLHERDYILVVEPRTGTELGRIDLSLFADADGLPEAATMARVGNRVFVGIQRLDRTAYWEPAGDSYLAVIDAETDALIDADPTAAGVQGVRLAATNPGALQAVGSLVIVQAVGSYMALDGGIEVVDASTLASRGLLVTEEQLGGQCDGLAMASPTRGYTTAATWPDHRVVPFDLSARTVGAALQRHSGGYTPSLAVDGDRLLVADRGTAANPNAAGLLVYDAATGAYLAGPISTGLPPNHITVLREAPSYTAVTDAAAAVPRDCRLETAYPNPFNAGTCIPYTVTSTAWVSLTVRDALGQRVRTLVQGQTTAGRHLAIWDGRTDAGQRAASGVYLVELHSAGFAQAATVVLAK